MKAATAGKELGIMTINDVKCPICSKATVPLCRRSKLTRDTKFSWESDMAAALLNRGEIEVQVRLCADCLYAVVFPKYDTSILYGEEAEKIKKRMYEEYFPGRSYYSSKTSLDCKAEYLKASNEFRRISGISEIIRKMILGAAMEVKSYEIMDYGGGDGYLSSIIAKMISATSGIPANSYVYDLTDWENKSGNEIDLSNIPQNKFHLIIIFHVLEHTHDPVGLLKSAVSYLHSGGILLCEVPDEILKMASALVKNNVRLGHHVGVFSSRSIFKIFKAAGFHDIKCEYLISSYRGVRTNSIIGAAVKDGRGESRPKSAVAEWGFLPFRFIKAIILRVKNGSLPGFH